MCIRDSVCIVHLAVFCCVLCIFFLEKFQYEMSVICRQIVRDYPRQIGVAAAVNNGGNARLARFERKIATVACRKQITTADVIVVMCFHVLFLKLLSANVADDCTIEFVSFVVSQCLHWNVVRENVVYSFRHVKDVTKKRWA